VVLLAAFAPGVLAGRNPLQSVPRDKLQSPNARHWFGTDQLGRDLYTRVVHGASLSLRATAIAVSLALVAGSVIGLVAGSAGRLVDDIAMRFVDMLLSIPALLLSLVVVTALGFGTTNVAIAVGIASTARFARVMRAEVLRVRSMTYVEAAHATGVRRTTVLLRHVLPHATGPVLVLAALGFGTATLAVSALSFLGYGARPSGARWWPKVATTWPPPGGSRPCLAWSWR
jgi:peptide/nickel transport system permease protein